LNFLFNVISDNKRKEKNILGAQKRGAKIPKKRGNTKRKRIKTANGRKKQPREVLLGEKKTKDAYSEGESERRGKSRRRIA